MAIAGAEADAVDAPAGTEMSSVGIVAAAVACAGVALVAIANAGEVALTVVAPAVGVTTGLSGTWINSSASDIGYVLMM